MVIFTNFSVILKKMHLRRPCQIGYFHQSVISKYSVDILCYSIDTVSTAFRTGQTAYYMLQSNYENLPASASVLCSVLLV